jgi:hypothetical protein
MWSDAAELELEQERSRAEERRPVKLPVEMPAWFKKASRTPRGSLLKRRWRNYRELSRLFGW